MGLSWRLVVGALLVLGSAEGHAAQKPNSAEQILAAAEAQAQQQHKLVFFTFGASWCGPCHELERFVAAPEIAPILEKYFVLAKVHIDEEQGKHPELNTPGSEELRKKLGGSQGVPFFVFLDAQGRAIATSARPVEGNTHGENIGYPDAPEEIDWFMAMLNKSVPEMKEEEVHRIEGWLQRASSYGKK